MSEENSVLEISLANQDSWKQRIAELLTQQAMVIVDTTQTPNPDPNDLAFARKVEGFAQSIANNIALLMAGSPNVRTTITQDTSGNIITSVTDAALASQLSTYWHFFATSGNL